MRRANQIISYTWLTIYGTIHLLLEHPEPLDPTSKEKRMNPKPLRRNSALKTGLVSSLVFAAYVMGGRSQLTFWHGTPEINEQAEVDCLGQYYMTFTRKADYPGPFDENGIPMLDYRGRVGVQYNPIAISQRITNPSLAGLCDRCSCKAPAACSNFLKLC